MRVLVVGALAAGLGLGCRSTVRLELPPSPAVTLPGDAVAIVARDRSCQASADALVEALGRFRTTDPTGPGGALRVDPRADLRIDLFNCGDDQQWTVEHATGPEGPRMRTVVEGRSHAVAAVSYQGRVLANLIGAGREDSTSSWDEPTPFLHTRNAVRREAREDLARDLVQQLNPLPTLVERRVYPNAASGSARSLTTLAVEAERSGDLDAAVELAQAAWQQDPNPRTAGYLAELRRRRDLQ